MPIVRTLESGEMAIFCPACLCAHLIPGKWKNWEPNFPEDNLLLEDVNGKQFKDTGLWFEVNAPDGGKCAFIPHGRNIEFMPSWITTHEMAGTTQDLIDF